MRRVFGLALVFCLTFVGAFQASATPGSVDSNKPGILVVTEKHDGQDYIEFLVYIRPKVDYTIAVQKLQEYVASFGSRAFSPLVVLDGLKSVRLVIAQMPVDKFTECFGGEYSYNAATKGWHMVKGSALPPQLEKFFVAMAPDVYMYEQVMPSAR